MYIKEKWSASNVAYAENLETFTLDIKQLNSPKMKVGVVYRPPDSNVERHVFNSFYEYLIHFTNIYLKMVLSQNVSRGLGLNIHVKLL